MATWKQVTTGPKVLNLQAQGRAYTRYDRWYYFNYTYGDNYQQFNSGGTSSTLVSTWPTHYRPNFVSPVDGIFKSYGVYGNCSSTNADFEFTVLKGTPNYSNNATATNLTQCGSAQSSTWTRNRLNKFEVTDPSAVGGGGGVGVGAISVSKGDIFIPAWRRTSTPTSSTYNYFELTINVTLEYE